jgi:hypothetical protein
LGGSLMVTRRRKGMSSLLRVNWAFCLASPACYRSVGSRDAVSYFLMKNSGLPVALIPGRLDWALP